MSIRFPLALGCAVGVLGCAPALADVVSLTAGPVIGTLGVGGEVGLVIPGGFGLRAQGTVLPVSMTFTTSTAPYGAKVTYLSGAVLADYYFFANVFRVTGGLRFGHPSVGLSSTPGALTIDGMPFTAQQVGTLTGTLRYNSVQPYLGIGAETSPAGLMNLTLGIDAGAMYMGSPTATLTAANPMIPASFLASEQSQIQSSARRYQFYPVLDVAVKYRF